MLLQSLLRPVLTPLMRGMFDAPIFSSAPWPPLALWPDGIATPGMWISPRTLTSQWQDYTGTTPVVEPGTVADSSNPVGLALDIRAGATVLTDPGNHMLQSTSTSRPLLSARVNLLKYSEDFSNAVWTYYVSTRNGLTTAPDGTETAQLVTLNSQYAYVTQEANLTLPSATNQLWVRRISGNTELYLRASTGALIYATPITITDEWVKYSSSWVSDGNVFSIALQDRNASGQGQIAVWHPQLNLGPTATDYQSVPGDGSTYASGPPIAQLYDGTDDGMATAAFAAGTLIDGMDCMIVVRRDSAAATYLISDTGSRGFFEWESGNSGRPDVSAGTPTYYVDGVACTATRGAQFTALTAGDWHIVEARNLDLSAWTALEVSSLASYRLNGPRGDILLYPSTASTTDKDAARQWLADYYGVTLP